MLALEKTEVDKKLRILRQALIEGEQSDDAGVLDMQAIIHEAKSEL
jgi:hypothetical protein